MEASIMRHVIKVTAVWGGVLFVSNVRQDWDSGFGVRTRPHAKVFGTKARAEEAISKFTPSVKGTTFEAIPA
jgi:hypothetical protein